VGIEEIEPGGQFTVLGGKGHTLLEGTGVIQGEKKDCSDFARTISKKISDAKTGVSTKEKRPRELCRERSRERLRYTDYFINVE